MPNAPTSPEASGYRRLANYMAWDPTCAILSRFRAANLMNLLGLQAEVSQLQEEVEVLMFNDRHKSGPRSAFAVDWSSLYKEDIQQDGLQQKVLDLRLKLREYNEALLHHVKLNKQPEPHPRDLEVLQQWLKDRRGGNSELRGPGADVWFSKEDDAYILHDKLALAPGLGSRDPLTRLIITYGGRLSSLFGFLRVEHRSFPARDRYPGQADFVIYSSSARLASAGDKITTVLASLLITIPIIALRFVNSTNTRLGLIILFTFVFSFGLVVLGNARRNEVFAASAAFAAVQVVFVAGVSSGNGS